MNTLNTCISKKILFNKEQTKFTTSTIFRNNIFNKELFNNPFKDTHNTLLILCLLSAIVYKYNEHYINNILNSWKLDYKLSIICDIVYGIFYTDTFIVISFKGSSSYKDILNDLKFIETDDTYNIPGKMHKGFHDLILTNNISETIREKLEYIVKTKDKQQTLYITGHSMGAALATIFHSYLKTCPLLDVNMILITYGCPRVGNYEFSTNALGSIRVVNGGDLVTKVPPCIFYKHPENTEFHINKEESSWSIDDHHILSYYSSLLQLQ